MGGSSATLKTIFCDGTSVAKKESKPPPANSDEICELCAGTGKVLQMHSARRGHPDFGSLNCAVCGGTGRIKKPKPK